MWAPLFPCLLDDQVFKKRKGKRKESWVQLPLFFCFFVFLSHGVKQCSWWALDWAANSSVESHVITPCCASDWPDNHQAHLVQDVAKTGGRSQNRFWLAHMQEQEYYHRYIELILKSASSGVHSRSPSQIDTCSEIKQMEKAEALRPPPLICTLYSGRNKLSQVSVGFALSHPIKARPHLGCSI